MPFSTSEAILAYSLYIAGCKFLDENRPCFNLFDADILKNLGYQGTPVGEAAEQAWKAEKKGHVEYIFKLTPRTSDLIRAYRDQCKEIEGMVDGIASELVLRIVESAKKGAILEDEALLRISCVILKTRVEFVNLWKKMVPLLRVPVVGKTRHFDTTATARTSTGNRIVEAKGVQKPGFKVISLNASEKTRKAMDL